MRLVDVKIVPNAKLLSVKFGFGFGFGFGGMIIRTKQNNK
jgi:hypothetical protein